MNMRSFQKYYCLTGHGGHATGPRLPVQGTLWHPRVNFRGLLSGALCCGGVLFQVLASTRGPGLVKQPKNPIGVLTQPCAARQDEHRGALREAICNRVRYSASTQAVLLGCCHSQPIGTAREKMGVSSYSLRVVSMGMDEC